MERIMPGSRLVLHSFEDEALWFLPAECKVIESARGLRGCVVRATLLAPIPLRNSDICELVLLVEEAGVCDVYMGLSHSMELDPILQIGRVRVA